MTRSYEILRSSVPNVVKGSQTDTIEQTLRDRSLITKCFLIKLFETSFTLETILEIFLVK